jgi:hypothetical protein
VEFGTRATLSDTEFTQRQAQAARQAQTDDEEVVVPRAGGGGDGTGPPSHWGERGEAQRQNSLIVDPADGRMPKMTPYGAERMAMRARKSSTGDGPFNSAADLDYYDRCVSRGVVGSILPVVYNNGTEIVQAPGYVAIRYEMIHDTRIIPLAGRPAPAAAIRQYMGDARGHWDGDTLVVETTNFMDANAYRGASSRLKMTERFTLAGPNTIKWEARFEDPATWEKPWAFTMPLKRDTEDGGLFEYACHEGNRGLHNILSAARAEEAKK